VRRRRSDIIILVGAELRRQLEASRDYIFFAAGIPQDLFRDN